MKIVHLLSALCLLLSPVSEISAFAETCCEVSQRQTQIELRSPFFVYRLDRQSGLRAETWENRLTGKSITLGGGSELDVDLGELDGPHPTPAWQVSPPKIDDTDGADAEVVFLLTAKEPALSATVTYRWNEREPVLHKFVKITNDGEKEIRVLNVRLGTYKSDAKLIDREQGNPISGGINEGGRLSAHEKGFPVYLDDEYFMSLAHPSGWATAEHGDVSLRQYPGVKLAAGASFKCMEAVYGVGRGGEAQKNFVAHVKNRMRRVVRGHDKPYAIYDNFGSWPEGAGGNWTNSDKYELHSLRLLAKSQEATGCRFDFCNIHFWVDSAGDMKGWDPQRFPQGIKNVKAILDPLGTKPGLWICSAVVWGASWGLNGDRAAASLTEDPSWFCRASEPIKSMFRDAFVYHLREEGVRLLKFDMFHNVCNNPHHEHLPGLYSTEAIENSVIEFLHDLDRECPEVFLILYWGYRSPWWLLHGDTLFDSGINIEAATPSSLPAAYVRDSVTQKLDQAQWVSGDVPALGKDSLGIWLSNWGWNSSIGKEHWQEGFVMDICRGSMLAQIWADNDWLSPPEWKELADFIALLRAQPGCFGNSRFILGNPWKDEPYGYCCTDGRRAFLAINNSTWEDRSVPLELNAAWGLPAGQRWDLYRWYPNPARLVGDAEHFDAKTAIMLKPFEVVLLEVVPAGEKPSLDRELTRQAIPTAFEEASRSLDLTVRDLNTQSDKDAAIWTILAPSSAVSRGGATLAIEADGSIFASGRNPSPDDYTVTANTKLTKITGIRLEAMADPRLPSHGPGRVFNGNFALSEFNVTASPNGGSADADTKTIRLQKPSASYSQESFGGWPVAAAIDGDPKTAWSIDPREGETQTAVFETAEPVELPDGGTLRFTLDQGYREGSADHTIGRFRLSVTTAKPPLPRPVAKDAERFTIKAQVPASRRGGVIVIAAALKKGSEAVAFRDIGTYFAAEAKLTGQPSPCEPVIGKLTYPSSWQAWRIAVGPSARAEDVELAVSASAPGGVTYAFQGHFIPNN
jgi:hypothetical protein